MGYRLPISWRLIVFSFFPYYITRENNWHTLLWLVLFIIGMIIVLFVYYGIRERNFYIDESVFTIEILGSALLVISTIAFWVRTAAFGRIYSSFRWDIPSEVRIAAFENETQTSRTVAIAFLILPHIIYAIYALVHNLREMRVRQEAERHELLQQEEERRARRLVEEREHELWKQRTKSEIDKLFR